MEAITFSGFGDLLKTGRKRRGLTQKELATRLGVHRNTIGTWENGDFLPESKTIVLELARQLQLDTDETRRLLEASLTALSPYWYVPYQRNPFFTGREDMLHLLHDVLAQGQAALLSQSYALSGLGGIGKTQTAIEYAYRYADDYTAVFWISAETPETLISSMIVIANMLNLLEKQDQDQEKVVRAVMRWFSNHKDWLLIFDNTEDPAQIKRFLPGTRSGSLLFTSRRQSLGLSAQTLTLERITPQEGMSFLLQRARLLHASDDLDHLSPGETELVQEIVAATDGLPLALDQAGAYIEATQCSLSDYVHLFRSSQVRLLDERDEHENHPLSVTKTFALAFQQITRSNPSAAEMLTICAYLAPEEIPELFFTRGASCLGPAVEILATDPLALQTAIKELLQYSLVQRNSSNATLSMHRLVQAVLKAQVSEKIQHLWLARVLRTITHLFPSHEDNQADHWKISEQLLPHALLCITLSEQLKMERSLRMTVITLMSYVASYLFKRARYGEAEALLQRALLDAEQTLEAKHLLRTEMLYELANIYRIQGKNEEAEPLFLQVIQIRETTLGAANSSLTAPLTKLAITYFNQGKYKPSEELFQRALAMLDQTQRVERLQYATTLNNIASLYIEQYRYEQAEQALQQALSIWEQEPQTDNLTINHPRINLAACYSAQGKYTQSIVLYEQVLHSWEKHFGSNHPQVAYPLHGLAIVYYRQGIYEKAELFDQHSLRIREQAFGTEHYLVASTLGVLAVIAKAQGKYAQAEARYQQALHISEQILGPEHPHVARILNNLADLYIEQGKYQQGESFCLRALHIYQQVHGPEDVNTTSPLSGLANYYHKQKKYTQAEPLYQQVLRIRENHLGQHPETAQALVDFAAFREDQGQPQEALLLHQRALAIREEMLGADHPDTQATQADYKRILDQLEQDKHKEP